MPRQILHYPRLDTILRVEKIVKESKEPLSKNGIDRRLHNSIMRPTLNVILRYLQESGKVAILKEGIIWIYREDISDRLKERLSKGVTVR
jgi:hypothetical protein